jgi:hypothetical protein
MSSDKKCGSGGQRLLYVLATAAWACTRSAAVCNRYLVDMLHINSTHDHYDDGLGIFVFAGAHCVLSLVPKIS